MRNAAQIRIYLHQTLSCITLAIPSRFSSDFSLQVYSPTSVLFTLVMIRVAFWVSLMLKRGKAGFTKGLLESLSPMVVPSLVLSHSIERNVSPSRSQSHFSAMSVPSTACVGLEGFRLQRRVPSAVEIAMATNKQTTSSGLQDNQLTQNKLPVCDK